MIRLAARLLVRIVLPFSFVCFFNFRGTILGGIDLREELVISVDTMKN